MDRLQKIKKFTFLFLFTLMFNQLLNGQMIEHIIQPSQTDTGITGNNVDHHCYLNTIRVPENKLLIFFPGTNAKPWDYRLFQKTAADQGYHVIGLSYENLKSININVCPATQDSTCHARARKEVWFGEDSHDSLNIDYPNSVLNRIQKLLKFLSTEFPSENWDQYLINDTLVKWERVVLSGHSQGAGNATFGSKYFKVDRVIMFSWIDWMWPGKNPDWISAPGLTPDSSYYGFIHTGDASIFSGIPVTWNNLGMLHYGPITSTDTAQPPYHHTHSLITSMPIDTTPTQTNYHNSTAVDWVTPINAVTGIPVLRQVWEYLLKSDNFKPDAKRISADGITCIDPEIYSDLKKIAYQSIGGKIWLHELDPLTGEFYSGSDGGLLIDSGATPLINSFNGPEFGYDNNGWAIFYTKPAGSTSQAWRATLSGNNITKESITSGAIPRISILASKSSFSESIRLIFSKGASLNTGMLGWSDENEPGNELIIDSTDIGVRWADGTRKFFYIKQTGEKAGQIFLYNTENLSEIQITDDSEIKSYSYGWVAPEFNELIMMAVINDSSIGIYKDNGGNFWEKIITIDAPRSSNFSYIGSPEPFIAGNKSYISFVTKEIPTGTNYVNSEVWVTDIQSDENLRLMQRCDDGAPSQKRTDPESFTGENEVFIYYNTVTESGIFEIWRYSTNISVNNPVSSGEKDNKLIQDYELHQNYPNPFNPETTISYSIPSASNVRIVIYDLLGGKIKTLINEQQSAGRYNIRFEAGNLPSGLYFYQIIASDFVKTKKMLLIR